MVALSAAVAEAIVAEAVAVEVVAEAVAVAVVADAVAEAVVAEAVADPAIEPFVAESDAAETVAGACWLSVKSFPTDARELPDPCSMWPKVAGRRASSPRREAFSPIVPPDFGDSATHPGSADGGFPLLTTGMGRDSHLLSRSRTTPPVNSSPSATTAQWLLSALT